MKTLILSTAHQTTAPAWLNAVVGRTGDRYSKRKELRVYVGHNLAAGQVSFHHAQTAHWASKGMLCTRSAYSSAKEAFRAEFSVYRGAFAGTRNPLHFANR